MKQLRLVFFVFAAVVLSGIAWQVVRTSQPPAKWLRVEAPRAVAVNGTLSLRLTLSPPAPSGLLGADLHWSGSRHEPHGYLSGSAPQAVTSAGGVFNFAIPVPPRPNLQRVFAVIYLGPSDRWSERTHAAMTEEIPVAVTAGNGGTALVPLAVHDEISDPEIRVDEVPPVRGLIALLWAVAAWCGGRNAGRTGAADGRIVPSWIRQHWLALACLAAALLEGSGCGLLLTGRLRAFALAHHFYFERRGVQQLATLGAIVGAAGVGWFALVRVRPPGQSLALLALGCFAALALAEVISQHEVDRLFAMALGPLPLIQVLKLAAAGVALAGLWPAPSAADVPVAGSNGG